VASILHLGAESLLFVPKEYWSAHAIISQDQEKLNELNSNKNVRLRREKTQDTTMHLHYFSASRKYEKKKYEKRGLDIVCCTYI
jgi:hypothetical protein